MIRAIVRTGAALAAGLVFGTGCGLVSSIVATGPVTHPDPPQPCTGYDIDGVEVVTFMHGDAIECDLAPPQVLHIVYPAGHTCDVATVYVTATKTICREDY